MAGTCIFSFKSHRASCTLWQFLSRLNPRKHPFPKNCVWGSTYASCWSRRYMLRPLYIQYTILSFLQPTGIMYTKHTHKHPHTRINNVYNISIKNSNLQRRQCKWSPTAEYFGEFRRLKFHEHVYWMLWKKPFASGAYSTTKAQQEVFLFGGGVGGAC